MAAGVTAINVLSSAYAEDCRIKGSVAVDLKDLATFVAQMPRDVELVVYCAQYSCPLSRDAWKLLRDLGFTRIFAYEGGVQEWLQKGYPTEGACALSYLRQQIKKIAPDGGVQTIDAEELRKKLRV
jgi:rhodanese-related sulfurtransferase